MPRVITEIVHPFRQGRVWGERGVGVFVNVGNIPLVRQGVVDHRSVTKLESEWLLNLGRVRARRTGLTGTIG
jgi:hypothetical protein